MCVHFCRNSGAVFAFLSCRDCHSPPATAERWDCSAKADLKLLHPPRKRLHPTLWNVGLPYLQLALINYFGILTALAPCVNTGWMLL